MVDKVKPLIPPRVVIQGQKPTQTIRPMRPGTWIAPNITTVAEPEPPPDYTWPFPRQWFLINRGDGRGNMSGAAWAPDSAYPFPRQWILENRGDGRANMSGAIAPPPATDYAVFPMLAVSIFDDDPTPITYSQARWSVISETLLGGTMTYLDGGGYEYRRASPPVSGTVSFTYRVVDVDGPGGAAYDATESFQI